MHVKSSKCKKLHGREVCYFLTQKTLNRSLLGMCISKCMFDSVLCIQDCREKKKKQTRISVFYLFCWIVAAEVKVYTEPDTMSPCTCHPGSLAGVTTGSSTMSWQWPQQGWVNHNPKEERQTNLHAISFAWSFPAPKVRGCVQLFMFLIKTQFQDSEIRPSQTFWVS